ncbi:MAG: hypothetical protein P4N41_25235 [Negativicutes bacterium]|nr:hypothetical protein [Negativicutes bacterium]
MVTCPVCNKRGIGRVGSDQYYCWECCVEFTRRGENVKIFNVESDGSLTSYVDPNLQLQEG